VTVNSALTASAVSAIAATIARYADVRPADRHYVRIKLRTDPLTSELVADELQLGDTLDVGCGRGQFGLLLYELGRVRSLCGFDWDAAKVATANAAARGVAHYETGDLRAPPTRNVDTALVFDVLQYLTAAEQRHLLASLVRSLRPAGRLLIRASDRSHGWQASLSQTFERIGRRLGVNRSHVLEFRSSETLKRDLEELGLVVRAVRGGNSTLLDNRLWVAELEGTRADS
jgi:SAM-dependent methyltransferase